MSEQNHHKDTLGTRERIIAAAAGLFSQQGYATISFRQIAAEANAPMGSMYFHFPDGKEEVIAAAVRHAGTTTRALLENVVADASPADVVRRISMMMGAILTSSDWQDGCPIATNALEAAPSSNLIREAADEVFASWEQTYIRRLVEAGVATQDADALGPAILAGIEGGLLLARTHRDLAALTAITDVLAQAADAASPSVRPR